YAWTFGDDGTSATASPSHKYSAAGTYSVKLVITSNNGCKDSITKSVIAYPLPKANWTANNECIYNAVSFSNSSSVASPYTIATYAWNFGDGGTSSSASPTHNYASAGTYSVKLTITTNKGCVDSLWKSVVVYPKPKADFTSTNRCGDSSLEFTNASSISTG